MPSRDKPVEFMEWCANPVTGDEKGQAFDYWTRLVLNRPRYVIFCTFDTDCGTESFNLPRNP